MNPNIIHQTSQHGSEARADLLCHFLPFSCHFLECKAEKRPFYVTARQADKHVVSASICRTMPKIAKCSEGFFRPRRLVVEFDPLESKFCLRAEKGPLYNKGSHYMPIYLTEEIVCHEGTDLCTRRGSLQA